MGRGLSPDKQVICRLRTELGLQSDTPYVNRVLHEGRHGIVGHVIRRLNEWHRAVADQPREIFEKGSQILAKREREAALKKAGQTPS